jgi:hypothetical protein
MGNTSSTSSSKTTDPDGTTFGWSIATTPKDGNYNYNNNNGNDDDDEDEDDVTKTKYRSFPGSAMLEKTFCGSIDTTDPSEYDNVSTVNRILKRAEILCVSSPLGSTTDNDWKSHHNLDGDDDDDGENSVLATNPTKSIKKKKRNTSKLLARALVSEVTDNPKTMTQAAMQNRERKLLKAAAAASSPDKRLQYDSHAHQQQQRRHNSSSNNGSPYQSFSPGLPPVQQRKPIGVATPPHFVRSVAYACTGDDDTMTDLCNAPQQELSFYQSAANTSELNGGGSSGNNHNNSNHTTSDDMDDMWADHPNVVTIGVALSRLAQNYDTHTKQPINGHPSTVSRQTQYDFNELQDRQCRFVSSVGPAGWRAGGAENGEDKLPDETHIPIIRIHCPTESSVDAVIAALASGEIFIPYVQILPEQLTVHNCSSTGSTNLVVHFGCERSDEVPVEEWPNWCLEFLHNQLYEYFASNNGVNGGGAVWMKRSFSTTLAKQVRWKTVKHMNRYFAASESVIATWRELGPQSLTPTPSHLEGGASADEVARPHGIYLYRGGIPTNYFCPNFEPPYTTKMTRSLLMTVLQKSWDKKRREWSSKPVPRVVEPSALLAAACGYSSDLGASGYMAHEVTNVTQPPSSTSVKKSAQQAATQSPFTYKEPLSVVEFGRTFSEDVSLKENSSRKSGSNVESTKKSPSRKTHGHSPSARPSSTKSARRAPLPPMDDSENNASVAPSAHNASVAESGTTVLHANSSKAPVAVAKAVTASPQNQHRTVMDTETNSRRLYSDEDFLDDVSGVDVPPLDLLSVTSPRGAAIAAEERLQQQQQQLQPTGRSGSGANVTHHQLSVVRQNAAESPTSSPTKRAQMKLDREKRALQEQNNQIHYSTTSSKVVGVEPSASLEYSTDGSSAYFHDPLMAAVQQASKVNMLQPLESNHSEDDDESNLLSLQESSSSIVSAIPTDEALFSVGWAKTLDPGSGNYYYFTLDRTRTVWENPLSASQWGGELPPPVVVHHNPKAATTTKTTMTTTIVHRPIDP